MRVGFPPFEGGRFRARSLLLAAVAVAPWMLPPSPAGAQAPAPAWPSAAEWSRALERGDYPRAAALARRRLAAAPKDVGARLVLARAEAALGRFDAAYDGFRQALRLEPRNADALYYLGMTAGVLAQREQERVLALAPGSSRAHQLQAQSYQAQGRPHEAAAAYKSALEADPRSLELLLELGDLMRSQLQLEDALAYYTRALAIAPRRFEVLYGLGVVHSFRREHALAVERLREALTADASSAAARFALARSLLMAGQAEAAVTELLAVTTRQPRMREAYYMLGRAYQTLGRAADAQRAFARVQELVKQGVQSDETVLQPEPQ
jgi:tetratricopeptide (TPR) repeat protein